MSLKDLIVRGPKPQEKRPRIRRSPVGIDVDTWFYDDSRGILVVHECRERDAYLHTDQFVIPWARLLAAVERYKSGHVPKPRLGRRRKDSTSDK